MHVPSPSDYIPFDPYSPHNFQEVEINNLILVALVTLALYDHLITLDIEVERIWLLKWRLPKYLFLTSHYILPPLLLLTTAGRTIYHALPSFCTFIVHFHRSTRAVSLIVAELVLLIRVSALYGHNKITLRILTGLFICQLVAVIILTVFVMKAYTVSSTYEFLPGCWPDHAWQLQSMWWTPFACFDGILFILTLMKTLSHRKNPFPTVRLLARDSVLYFAIAFGSLVINMLENQSFLVVKVAIPTEWIACIAVSRMMMNIRGLVFDDPRGTIGIELSRIEFREHHCAEDSDVCQVPLRPLS